MPSLPHPGNCAGEERAAIFGCGLLTSYLFLFIDFYIRTYKGGAKRAGSKRDVGKVIDKDAAKVVNGINSVVNGNGYTNGHANGKVNGKAQ